MGKLTSLTLGIITAIGGFVDMGELVTCSQSGATYGFGLLWTVVVGTCGIIVFADMSGRVAIASGRSLFDVIRAWEDIVALSPAIRVKQSRR